MITNCYEDSVRAESYSKLEFPGTYYLAYRDLPEIISNHVNGNNALDFGCGAGRSTRFLEQLGYNTIGVDIANDMIEKAKEINPEGEYQVIEDGKFNIISDNDYDLVLSVFTFDNIPTFEKKQKIFKEFKRVLKRGGKVINLVSSPEIYKHEWASFSTKDFPENKTAKCGEKVKIIMKDVDDKRPVEDIIWPEEDYFEVYEKAGFQVEKVYRPLANHSEPFEWINETKIAPWVIYVLT